MKTARFTTVVQKCGKPEVHLSLVKPAKDRSLQAAIKARRVMSIAQENIGTRTDRGEVGFKAGSGRQYLIFPKSLRAFEGRSIFGINYDLLAPHKLAKGDRVARRPTPKKELKTAREKSTKTKHTSEKTMQGNVFERALKKDRDREREPETSKSSPRKDGRDVAEMKKGIRQALKDLEAGKTVAAFHRLQAMVEKE